MEFNGMVVGYNGKTFWLDEKWRAFFNEGVKRIATNWKDGKCVLVLFARSGISRPVPADEGGLL